MNISDKILWVVCREVRSIRTPEGFQRDCFYSILKETRITIWGYLLLPYGC